MRKGKLFNGQRYEFVREEDYQRKSDGKWIKLPVWSSLCAECGARFEVKTVGTFAPSRRCQEHRMPGRPVRAKVVEVD